MKEMITYYFKKLNRKHSYPQAFIEEMINARKPKFHLVPVEHPSYTRPRFEEDNKLRRDRAVKLLEELNNSSRAS